MSLAVDPGFGWFIRAARILSVVAVAAFAGAALGGYIVFTMNGTLFSTPDQDMHANSQPPVAIVRAKSVGIVGGAMPDPAAGARAPSTARLPSPVVPGSAQTQTLSAPSALPLAKPLATMARTLPENTPAPTRWPNALLRAREKVAPPALRPPGPSQPGAGEEVKNAEADRKRSANASASADADRAAVRRHGRAARKREMQYSATAGARQAGDRSYNRVYDYYDATGEQRFGSDERYGARRRTIGRAQRPDWTQCAQALVRSILGRRRILSRLAMNAGTPAIGA